MFSLLDCFEAFRTVEERFILTKFDVLYSVMVQFPQFEERIREQAWELLSKGMIVRKKFGYNAKVSS